MSQEANAGNMNYSDEPMLNLETWILFSLILGTAVIYYGQA